MIPILNSNNMMNGCKFYRQCVHNNSGINVVVVAAAATNQGLQQQWKQQLNHSSCSVAFLRLSQQQQQQQQRCPHLPLTTIGSRNHHQRQFMTSTAAASKTTTTTTSDDTTINAMKQQQQQQQQQLYMWGIDQHNTILNPATQPLNVNANNTTNSSTSVTTSNNSNQKYDVPTLMYVQPYMTNGDDDTTTTGTTATTTTTTKISKIICGPTETALLLSNGLCYVTGKNEYGQLGFGHTQPITTTTTTSTGTTGSTTSPTLLTCCNKNFENIDNDETDDPTTTTTTTSSTTPKIRHVAFGTNFAAYLVEPPVSTTTTTTTTTTNTAGGYDLYTCGFGGSTMAGVGCLGHGTINSYTRPKLVESLYEDNIYVRDVVAGEAHCTILTNEYEILTTGSGSYGRLGNFDTTDQLYFEPVEIELSSSSSYVHQIAGGKSFTLALSNDGKVYGWGRNHKGQLGTGLGLAVDMYAMQSVPESISDTSDLLQHTNIVQIAAGHSHAACISDTGEVYHWGMSLHLEPVLVDTLLHTKIVDIVCGLDYTLAIDIHGHMYSFGNGNYSLGHGKDVRQLNQAKRIEIFQTGIHERSNIPNTDTTTMIQRKIIHAAAGWKHAAVLLEEEHIEKPKDYSTIIS